jgi:hypothetical protein
MSASRTTAASGWVSTAWWRSIAGGEAGGKLPAPREHAAHERVVDPKLEPLGAKALLGGARLAVDLVRVAGVGLDEDELADVVEERRHEHAVAIGLVDLAAMRSAARWTATACRRKRSGATSQVRLRSKK